MVAYYANLPHDYHSLLTTHTARTPRTHFSSVLLLLLTTYCSLGENPAHSVAMVGGRGKLYGVQCNDGYGRLGAEDGLMFGSVHYIVHYMVQYIVHHIHYIYITYALHMHYIVHYIVDYIVQYRVHYIVRYKGAIGWSPRTA